MTIKYALTKAEILLYFVLHLGRHPMQLAIISGCSLWIGFLWLATGGAFSRSFTIGDGITGLAWSLGMFCFYLFHVFIRGKTDERTMRVSEKGIWTAIGSHVIEVPWEKVKIVADAGRFVVIVRTSGNAFFIPNRAFSGTEQRAQFLEETDRWRKAI